MKMVLAAAGVLAAAAPVASQAQVPGPHPAYLHALSDLRAARHYLADGWAWGPVRHDDDMAIHEIDKAIDEIKHASIDDGKGLNDPFPIDRSLSPHDRFRKANELLAAASTIFIRLVRVIVLLPSDRGCRIRTSEYPWFVL
jgi:hypothetical protein